MTEDGELLRRYIEEDSQEAFTELVQRHINAVHAVAMRRANGDSHLAADVTQKVFISLARHARELVRHPAITGWLYTSTRNAVLDTLRSESRRQRREEEAMAMIETETTANPISNEVLLAALDELGPKDREAVLLRFFQGCAFRQIGTALHLNENAARMRVDRATARLRSLLERRGVTSTTAALAATLAGNATLAAPASLTMQVTQAALAVGPMAGFTAGGLSSLFVSAKLPLGVAAAGLVVLGGWAYYQSTRVQQLQSSLVQTRTQYAALTDTLAARRAALRIALTPLPAPPSSVSPGARLRSQLAAMPDKTIPEVALLADGDWDSLARILIINNDAELFRGFRNVRERARARFARMAAEALRNYALANNGDLPRSTEELAPYFDEPLPAGILPRYVMLRTGKYDDVPLMTPVAGEIGGVEDETAGDSVLRFGRTMYGVTIAGGDWFGVRVLRAQHRWAAEHGGATTYKAEDLRAWFNEDAMPALQSQLDMAYARANPGQGPTRFRVVPPPPFSKP